MRIDETISGDDLGACFHQFYFDLRSGFRKPAHRSIDIADPA